MTNQPGWYADPSGRSDGYRWWDGRAWTGWLSEDGSAPAPESSVLITPVPVAHDDPGIRLPVAVGITTAVVLLAIIVLGGAVAISSDRLPSGRAVDPPDTSGRPVTILLDELTGSYLAGRVRMEQPAAPYNCYEFPSTLRSGSQNGLQCLYEVHSDYRPGQDWSADTGIGVVPTALVMPDDLRGTAQGVLDRLGGRGYEGIKLLNPTFKADPQPDLVNAPDEALKVTGSFGYRVPGLPSTSTNLTFVIIKLADSGSHVVFYAAHPGDAPKALIEAEAAAFASITAR